MNCVTPYEEVFLIENKKSRVSFVSGLPAFEDGDGLYVFDRNTAALFSRLPEASVVLDPGEQSKSWAGAEAILNAAFARGMARDSLFTAVGGGMICDLTAFAASVFMRGARARLVPTTLLSMVDASFGGKTAINFGGYKNLVGTFFPAEAIIISAEFLDTLPRREFLSGLAEIVKYAMLGDAGLYGDLRKRGGDMVPADGKCDDKVFLPDMLRRTLQVKARFVMEDPAEKGMRAYLNFGHTFGHGLEAAGGFRRFTHGEGVAWGMMRALDAGVELGITDKRYAQEAAAFLKEMSFPEKVSGVSSCEILGAMEKDKKKQQCLLRFVLQKNLCDTMTRNLETGFVEKIVKRGLG
jgi:3-dehydroquinate synthase